MARADSDRIPDLNTEIALFLIQDGLTNGAIYALLALALVLVFAVTRVIFIPQGEYVAYGALTLAMIQNGHPVGSMWQRWGDLPGTLWLLVALALIVALLDARRAWRQGRRATAIATQAAGMLAVPLIVLAVAFASPPRGWPLWAQSLLTLAIVTPLGPLVYRLAYEKLADASVLVLLIV